MASCQVDARSKPGAIVNGLDIRKVTKKLNKIDFKAIRKRKLIYSRLFHEARVSHEGQGISFTEMLTLLAHHKIIVDADALV
jgi:voltage-dependent calcium channel